MKKYYPAFGIILSLILSQSVLGTRIDQGQADDLVNLIGSQTVIFILTCILWIINFYILYYDKKRITEWGKIIIALCTWNILSIVSYYISPFEDFAYHPLNTFSWPVALWRLIFRGSWAGGILYLIQYLLMKKAKAQNEIIKDSRSRQEALRLQLSFLQYKINPHFLFNTLNLIRAESREKWVSESLSKLSRVYKYLLMYGKETDLVLLNGELKFIRSYLSLFKERYGKALEITIDIEQNDSIELLPFLCLQLLVENALKHNIIRVDQPLKIKIFREGKNKIVVTNNFQPKRRVDSLRNNSGQFGLWNLQERYDLLSAHEEELKWENDGKNFTVKLPILRSGMPLDENKK